MSPFLSDRYSDLLNFRFIIFDKYFPFLKVRFIISYILCWVFRLERESKDFGGFMNNVPGSMIFWVFGFANLISKILRPLQRYTCGTQSM